MNLTSLLKYGAIGLGLALAILAFTLIEKEQTTAHSDPSMRMVIYAFMIFSICLSAAGFITESVTNQKIANLKQQLSQTQKTIKSLLAVKSGLIDQLGMSSQSQPLVEQVRSQLAKVDKEIGNALK